MLTSEDSLRRSRSTSIVASHWLWQVSHVARDAQHADAVPPKFCNEGLGEKSVSQEERSHRKMKGEMAESFLAACPRKTTPSVPPPSSSESERCILASKWQDVPNSTPQRHPKPFIQEGRRGQSGTERNRLERSTTAYIPFRST